MKISVRDDSPIDVRTEAGNFQVGLCHLGSLPGKVENGVEGWAIVAVSPDPLTRPRFLSRKFRSVEEAKQAYHTGFDVTDPSKEPRLTWSKIIKGMLSNPKVELC